MTEDEAKKVAEVVGTADGGCDHCVDDLVRRLNAAGLGFTFTRTDARLKKQPDWSDDPEDVCDVGFVISVERAQ